MELAKELKALLPEKLQSHMTVPDLIFDGNYSIKCPTTPVHGDNVARFIRSQVKEDEVIIHVPGASKECLKIIEQKKPSVQALLERYGKLSAFISSKFQGLASIFKVTQTLRTYEKGWEIIVEGLEISTGKTGKFEVARLLEGNDVLWGPEFLKMTGTTPRDLTLEFKLARN